MPAAYIERRGAAARGDGDDAKAASAAGAASTAPVASTPPPQQLLLPDEAVAAIVRRLPPRARGQLRLASRAWRADVARAAAALRLDAAAAAAGCCARHAPPRVGAALRAAAAAFPGLESLDIAVSGPTGLLAHGRGNGGGDGGGDDGAAAAASAAGGSSSSSSLEPLAALRRLSCLSIGEAPARGRGAARDTPACPLCAEEAGHHSHHHEQQQQQQQQPTWDGPRGSMTFQGGLPALTRLECLRLLAPHGYEAAAAAATTGTATGATAGPGAALLCEVASLPRLRRLELALPPGAPPGALRAALARLPALRALALRAPLLADRGLWLELGALTQLTLLSVAVARAGAPGCRFHLRDALAPLAALPSLADLSLAGFQSLADADLALAGRLGGGDGCCRRGGGGGARRGLTALRLRLGAGAPFHRETPLPGGGAGAAGARALAAGHPWLAELALEGCRLSHGGVAELLAGMTALRRLDLSDGGSSHAAAALLAAACGAGGGDGGAAPALRGLTALSLARCPGVDDALLAALAARAPCLEELDVSGRDGGGGGGADGGCGIIAAAAAARASSLPHALMMTAAAGEGGGCVTDAGVAQLAALRRLRVLRLDGRTRVTARGLEALLSAAASPSGPSPPLLEELSCAGCAALTDAALAAVGSNATMLRVLRLGGCRRVTNRGLRHLLALPYLEELALAGTLARPAGAAYLALRARVARLECGGSDGGGGGLLVD